MKFTNVLFFLTLASFFLYFPAEAHKARGHYLKTKWDDKIKPVPVFVIPYLFFFPYILGAFVWAFWTKNPGFNQLAISLLTTSVITTIIYIAYPSMMVRPFTRGDLIPKSWTEKLIKSIEQFDRPNNVFPSNHVAYSLVVTLFLVTALPSFALLFWILFGLIAASTVMIKQHDLADVPAGAALALVIWFVVGIFI